MTAREWPSVHAQIRLRLDRFMQITRILGCESDVARARLLDVDPKTIWRARRGIFGDQFIAHALAVLRKHEEQLAELGVSTNFDELFEVETGEAA